MYHVMHDLQYEIGYDIGFRTPPPLQLFHRYVGQTVSSTDIFGTKF
jgi:hypothetical protein